MNREELLKQRDKLQKELDKLTELINKKDIRFKPEYGEFYYYLDGDGIIQRTYWNDGVMDNYRYSVGNCFKTEEEVYDYQENLITKQQLKDPCEYCKPTSKCRECLGEGILNIINKAKRRKNEYML